MDDPMPTIYRIVDHATEELFEEIWRWGRKVDRMQQEMKKNGLLSAPPDTTILRWMTCTV